MELKKHRLLNSQSKKALQEIPKELSKLNKLIALIGEALLNREMKRVKQRGEQLGEAVKRKRVKADGNEFC